MREWRDSQFLEIKKMLKQYISQSGKVVEIGKMPDAYLLNSFAFYRKRVKTLEESVKGKGNEQILLYKKKLIEIRDSLKAEVERRGLFTS